MPPQIIQDQYSYYRRKVDTIKGRIGSILMNYEDDEATLPEAEEKNLIRLNAELQATIKAWNDWLTRVGRKHEDFG